MDQNDGLTPFGKMSMFAYCFWTKTMGFFVLEYCFFVLEYRKRHFAVLYCVKKKLEKWPFLD